MRLISFILLLFAFLQHNQPFQKQQSYDLCIYGGTSAGVIAAYTAAQMGKKVLLVEPGKHLGGMTSGGLGYTDIGNKYAISGVARDFYRKLGKHYGKFEQWTFEPHAAENLFKQYAKHKNVTVWYETRIVKANKTNNTIENIILESTNRKQNRTVSAKIFMDCGYEGDLMAKAGVTYVTGRESNDQYGETYNGAQLMEGHQFPDGVDPYRTPGDSSSGLLWGISNGKLNKAGSGDTCVQAYNYRICLTNDPRNKRNIVRPANYDSSRYELLLRLLDAQPGKRKLNDYFIVSRMPNNKTDINNRGGFSSDMIGMNHHYPEASYQERQQIIKQHEDYTKGLLYFIGHDERVPQALREEMLQWGYPKDEYVDNNNWSPQLYIRESRRMVGSYVMTQHNCQGREVITDTIGFAAYTMDSHNCQRLVVNGMVKNEGNVEIGGFGPYPIAYRSLVPKESECTNLLVPVCLSATHIAYGSIRMEPVFMVLAQSSAIAACMAIDNGVAVQQVDVRKVNELLRKDPLMDGSVPDILLDNDDTVRVKAKGNWKKVSSEPAMGYTGNYGPSMLVSERDGTSGNEVSFTPSVNVSGRYVIYYYVPKIAKGSTKIQLRIDDGRVKKDTLINTADVVVEGQTSGEWVSLGTHQLNKGSSPSVTVLSGEADGTLVADAVLFVHQR